MADAPPDLAQCQFEPVLSQLDAGLETSKSISRLLKRYCRLEENFAKEVHTVLNEERVLFHSAVSPEHFAQLRDNFDKVSELMSHIARSHSDCAENIRLGVADPIHCFVEDQENERKTFIATEKTLRENISKEEIQLKKVEEKIQSCIRRAERLAIEAEKRKNAASGANGGARRNSLFAAKEDSASASASSAAPPSPSASSASSKAPPGDASAYSGLAGGTELTPTNGGGRNGRRTPPLPPPRTGRRRRSRSRTRNLSPTPTSTRSRSPQREQPRGRSPESMPRRGAGGAGDLRQRQQLMYQQSHAKLPGFGTGPSTLPRSSHQQREQQHDQSSQAPRNMHRKAARHTFDDDEDPSYDSYLSPDAAGDHYLPPPLNAQRAQFDIESPVNSNQRSHLPPGGFSPLQSLGRAGGAIWSFGRKIKNEATKLLMEESMTEVKLNAELDQQRKAFYKQRQCVTDTCNTYFNEVSDTLMEMRTAEFDRLMMLKVQMAKFCEHQERLRKDENVQKQTQELREDLDGMRIEDELEKFAAVCLKKGGKFVRPDAYMGEYEDSRTVFTSLDVAIQLEQEQEPNSGQSVPRLVRALIDAIKSTGDGLQTEGLFRISALTQDVTALRRKVIDMEYNLECKTAHIPAAMLKQWLRGIEVPLIPEDLYDHCIKMKKFAKADITLLLDRLPGPNRDTLEVLLDLLVEAAEKENSSVSKMNAQNLAIVMSPNILRNSRLDPVLALNNTKYETLFLEKLIGGYEKYFC